MTNKPLLEVLTLITCFSALPWLVGLTGCASKRNSPATVHRIDDNRMAERDYGQNSEQRVEDSRTAERVREALAAVVDYKYDGVKVIACDGVVQLSGFVKSNAQKNIAGEVTSQVVGVKSVENNLTVKD
jgi:osmotically-inducible protein OsmY